MIIEALAEWNHWWKSKLVEEELSGKKRVVLKELQQLTRFREIKLFLGIRRSGKSTLFYQIISKLLDEGVAPEHILLINFEDDVLNKKTLREIFDAYQVHVNLHAKPYLFLDEVHRCPDWAPFLRKLYDLKKVQQVFITDSSSKFIKSEYAQLLTGRTITQFIFPLSFDEYLNWQKKSLPKIISREDANATRKEIVTYLKWGGFPEIVLKTEVERKRLLLEYFSDIIAKDIIERYQVSYPKIKPLADHLLVQTGALFSPRKYSKTFGLSLESIDTYIQYLKEVCLFFLVPKFAFSIKTQQLSPKKVYVSDAGFCTNVGFSFSENIGHLYENAVFIELKRRFREIYYWKETYECDFIIKEAGHFTIIQVCSSLNPQNKEREINGILEAMNTLKVKKGTIITDNYESREKIRDKIIEFIPLWKWLLKDPTPPLGIS